MSDDDDRGPFRIEAEVRDVTDAEILKETLENNDSCTLTAFEEATDR